jgi:hypothetical protein
MEKKTCWNYKRILINAFVLFTVLVGLSYASVVITNTDIQKNGISVLFQNMNGQTLTNGTINAINLSDGTMQCIAGVCEGILSITVTGNSSTDGILMDSNEIMWLNKTYIYDNGTATIIGRI